MDEFILLNNFQIDANEIDWYKATKKVITPLIENGFVKVEYEEAIMENLKRAGSKFIISPYIILPHARPEQGVNKNAISVLLLKHSVYYENSREPIRLIVVLASTDSVSHLVMLKKVAEILNKENNVSDILESETIRELYEKFA